MILLLLKSNFQLIFFPDFRFESGVLRSKFLILIIFILDHTAQFFLFLVISEEMILKITSFVISFPIFLLPVINFLLQIIIAILHSSDKLLVFSNLHLVIFVMIDFTVKFQFLLFKCSNLSVSFLEEIIKFL